MTDELVPGIRRTLEKGWAEQGLALVKEVDPVDDTVTLHLVKHGEVMASIDCDKFVWGPVAGNEEEPYASGDPELIKQLEIWVNPNGGQGLAYAAAYHICQYCGAPTWNDGRNCCDSCGCR